MTDLKILKNRPLVTLTGIQILSEKDGRRRNLGVELIKCRSRTARRNKGSIGPPHPVQILLIATIGMNSNFC
jgi:hypothetical protein